MDEHQRAMEELRLLQEIIRHQEDLRAQLTNWSVGLISAISIVFLSAKIDLSGLHYILVGSALIIAFFWNNIIFRVAQSRAIARSNKVEECLRQGGDYDGPKIGDSIGGDNDIGEQVRAMNNVRIYAPYVILLIFVIIVGISKEVVTSPSGEPSATVENEDTAGSDRPRPNSDS